MVTFDSDGQHLLSDLPNFLEKFKEDESLEVVLGSRFLGKAVNIPAMKVLTLKV